MSVSLIPRLRLQKLPLYNFIKDPVTSRSSHQIATINDEICDYPEIYDTTKEGFKKYQRQRWYDSIKAMPTVEEKLHELVIQQRMKLKKYVMGTVAPSYTGVLFDNFITRTHFVQGLPDVLENIQVENELSDIRDTFNENLLNFFNNSWEMRNSRTFDEYLNQRDTGSKFLNVLISQCYKKMALRNEHIMESTIQQKPRVNSFWWHAGFESEKDKLFERNLCFQYLDNPEFVIRMKNPLSPILRLDDPLCATADVPDYLFHPKVHGFPGLRNLKLTSIPGFWPGDPHEYPLLIVSSAARLKSLVKRIEKFSLRKIEESANAMASFGYLNAVATYQGFTPFHDLTYPLVAQTILTNGRDWTFSMYQLNTIAFHEDSDNKNRRNICWVSKKLRLFDTIEDGQIRGINDEVYKLLLKFLHNAPVPQDNLVLRPYLGVDTRSEEEIQNLRMMLRDHYSQRPAPDAHESEIPTWVWIYKMHPLAPPCPTVRLQ